MPEPEPALSLADLSVDPARAMELPPCEAASLLAKVEGLAAVLRVAAARSPSTNGKRPGSEVWLDPAAVAAKLGISVRAVYARKNLPWSRNFGRTKRMAESDLDAYLRGKRR